MDNGHLVAWDAAMPYEVCRWHWHCWHGVRCMANAWRHRAHAVHMPCPRRAHAVHMPCPRHALCDAAQVRMAAQRTGWAASAASSAVSGEGLMCFFQGPGRLWLQTHKPRLEPGAKGGGGHNQAGGGAVVFVIFMLFFFGIVALGIMFVAPAAFFNDRGGWVEATGQRHAEAMQTHRAHISHRHHGHGHGEL